MTNPSIIDVTDLHDPVLTPLQKQVLEAMEAQPVEISTEAILDAAMEQTGLSNFGADDFRERLDIWVQAINEDEGASNVTRFNMLQMYTRYAATRLRLEDLIARHPEILDIEIDRPLIVAGLPRSGTTHLLNLISADTRWRSLPWWEAIAPVPGPEDVIGDDGLDPRWKRAAEDWDQQDAILPYMKAMHGFEPDHVSEDIELQAIDFSSYLIEWLAVVPRWRDYYLNHDQTGTYAYLKKALQALTWLRGPNRWVLKCPQHMEQLPILLKTFPDATIVITHRDPVASIQSAITMSCYANRILRKSIDAGKYRDYWVDRYRILLERCVRDRDTLPDEQVIDVYFDELMADTDKVLKAIYQKADMPLTDEALADLHAYLDAHPQGKHGKVVYNLRRDFGTTPEEIRKRFDFYFERFPVKVQVK
ncbi:MAG: sulfotransferase family protein [Porticoccaceae bacterium]|nr:sulfotransferase family protein [Porticoccaceae bacterium]